MIWIAELVVWIGLLALTLYFRSKGVKTVSQRVEAFMPNWLDTAILAVIFVFVWWQGGENAAVVALRYIMVGHMLLGHETYGKK